MSMTIVTQVREKSNTRGSARVLLLNLAIYANDCCGVAWPSDATLYHEANVSRQRIHELKRTVEDKGEIAILARPGDTNLYFIAWQGKPLGGTSAEAPGTHDRRCPLRDPALWDRCARLWPDRYPPRDGARGVSEFSDGGGQNSLPQKQGKTKEKNQAPAAPCAHAPDPAKTSPPPNPVLSLDKPETKSPFWCQPCGYIITSCIHRTAYQVEAPPGRRATSTTGVRWAVHPALR